MLAWGVVKKFVCDFLENKVKNMAANVGIFILSSKSDVEIIEACNNLIKRSNSGGKITTVRPDKTCGGVKVYLTGDDIAQELIGKQFLFETGDDFSTIHPLVTHLTVHDAIVDTTEEEFIQEVQNIMKETLGPVLKVSKIPISELYPDIGSGNWKVILDVPEVEDLDRYKKSGLPDDFSIKVPSVRGRLAITFHCTKCKKDGHTQWRCSESIEGKTKAVLDSARREDSILETPSKPVSGFFIRDREESREREVSQKNTALLTKKNIREFESEIGKEEVFNYCDSVNFKDIKKEAGESSSSGRNSAIKRKLLSARDEGATSSKRANTSLMNDDVYQVENPPKASSTTNDADSLEILYESSNLIPLKNEPIHFPSPSVGGLFTRRSVDDSVSTSNQPAPVSDAIKSELPSTDENDPDSNLTPRTKLVRARKKPAQGVPVIIPDRIKNIISEIEDGVLDVNQLTAFLNHVKKKSRPCSFAEMYTTDVAGLKRQLNEIKRRYYMVPERGTNKEIQFMKWFVNTLDRFDGVPSTRKKNATDFPDIK